MKKSTIVSILIITSLGFAFLIYFGFSRTRGVPFTVEETERIVVSVPFKSGSVDLSEGVSANTWEDIIAKEVPLMHQVMVLPWGKGFIPFVRVKAFHNGKEIYFYLSWDDNTENNTQKIKKFSDACAIMFPLDPSTQTTAMAVVFAQDSAPRAEQKGTTGMPVGLHETIQPQTLMMGFLGGANIWQWKASRDREYWAGAARDSGAYADFHYPFEEKELFPVSKETAATSANDLVAVRVGTVTPKARQSVEARGIWKEASWHVVFKRSLKHENDEEDAIFQRGQKRLCAFAVWEGESGDRGGRKSISDWVELEIE